MAGGGKVGRGVRAAQQTQQPGGRLYVMEPGGATQHLGQCRDASPSFAKIKHQEGRGHGPAIERQRYFFHLVPQTFEQFRGITHGRGALRVQNAAQRVLQAEADAQAARRAADFFQIRPRRIRQKIRRAHIAPLGSIEHGGAVAH